MARYLPADDIRLQDYRPRLQVVAPVTEVESAAVPAVDAHCHLGRWLSDWAGRPNEWLVDSPERFLERMADRNVHAFVNLDGRWGAELAANLERFDRSFPGRFATFAHLDWTVLQETPAAASDRLAEQVRAAADEGAAGLKIWKDLGLTVRDGEGHLVLADDPRLEAMWAAAGECRLPVWWHTADPVAFFDPVDEHNENLEILLERPDWSFHGNGFPTFRRLVDALERVVSDHPRTMFVAVHGGCYAENLGWVGQMLDDHPNLHLDIAARLAQLGRRPRALRSLVLRHPDRVLFGTDEIPHTGSTYPTHFRFLETGDEAFSHTGDPDDLGLGRWTISGLDLPAQALHAVYAENATRLVPRLSVPAA